MIKLNSKLVVIINLVVGFLVVSPYLPGPYIPFANFIYIAGQMASLAGLITIPILFILLIDEWRWKWKSKDPHYKINPRIILLLTVQINLFVSTIYFSNFARDFSRNYAINRTDGLIKSIEKFKEHNGHYPDSLTELNSKFVIDVPAPFIMGINKYYYNKVDTSYTLTFYQSILMNFNFEVVTFDPTDSHKAEGELEDIYETGKSHWKYYVYD